jgi:hypothetical protein
MQKEHIFEDTTTGKKSLYLSRPYCFKRLESECGILLLLPTLEDDDECFFTKVDGRTEEVW